MEYPIKNTMEYPMEYPINNICSSHHQPVILLFQSLTIINRRLTID